MSFSKAFAKNIEGSNYAKWIEVFLDSAEEKDAEKLCRSDNIEIMKECVNDALMIMKEKDLKDYQSDVISIAVSLFNKRASYSVHWKEKMAKEKFDKI